MVATVNGHEVFNVLRKNKFDLNRHTINQVHEFLEEKFEILFKKGIDSKIYQKLYYLKKKWFRLTGGYSKTKFIAGLKLENFEFQVELKVKCFEYTFKKLNLDL